MPESGEQLIVRRHDRLGCDLAATLRVDETHADQIVFSRGIVDAAGQLPVRIVDCSKGGLGLRSPVYLPPGARINLTFRLAQDPPTTLALRVRRGAMLDRTPTYYLGAQVGESGESETALDALLRAADAASAGAARDGGPP